MSKSPNQVDVDSSELSPPSTQYGAPFNVNISFPEDVVIKMVDASALHDYEFALFISSIFSSAGVGFVVAYIQSGTASVGEQNLLLIISFVFVLMAVAFFAWGLIKRRKMTTHSKILRLKTSGIEEIASEEVDVPMINLPVVEKDSPSVG